MFYVYEWYVIESGEVFYVGKGTKNRYKVKKHNKFFNDFITRYECESRIIKEFESEQDAFEFEFETVERYKQLGQCVCNIYKGGMGGTTQWWNDELRKRYSEQNVMKSQKHRQRMSENNPMKNSDIAKRVGEKHRKKVCIGNKVYNGIIEVCKTYNIDSQAVYYWLERGYSREKEPCYFLGEEKPAIVLREHQSKMKSVIIDGVEYRSIREASDKLGFYSTNLGIALRKGKTTFNGHTIGYGNQQPSQGKSDNSTLEGSTTNG